MIHPLKCFSVVGYSPKFTVQINTKIVSVPYIQPSFVQQGVRGNHNSMLGETVLHKLCTGKVGLCACGHLRTPARLKVHTFLDILKLYPVLGCLMLPAASVV